jgi:hypothetical protein
LDGKIGSNSSTCSHNKQRIRTSGEMLPATLPTITTFLKILLSTRSAAREMKVVFFKCDWFDPINGTRVDDFDMVEVKHESRYSGINLLLAHQAQ